MRMKRYIIKLVCIALCISSINCFAQVKMFTWVKRTPKSQPYILENEPISATEGYFLEREHWLVMSDRSNNTTYKNPGADKQLKSLSFLDLCYVIKKKGDFVELVKYAPKLFKNPKKRLIGDRKSAEYLGWIHKSKLLLWRSALKDASTNKYIKAITCIKNANGINQFQYYHAGKDSLYVFGSPSVKDTLSQKTALEEIVYIYKQSIDGKHYLIGTAPQATTENVKEHILGWISKDLVQCWGTGLGMYVEPIPNTRNKDIELKDSLSFFQDSSLAAANFILPSYPFTTYTNSSVTNKKIENIFPAQQINVLTDSNIVIKTGVLNYTLDHDDNEVINILGNPLRYRRYKQIVSGLDKVNIVFVVDGGRENGRYMPNVMTLIQESEIFFDTSTLFNNYKYGVVVYKDNLGGGCAEKEVLPLTKDYGSVIGFLQTAQQNITKCNNDTIIQSMFLGLIKACQLLQKHRNENNIIVLIGGPGNINGGSYGYTEVISNLSYVNARMLSFQTHSLAHPTYNDFVIQSKNIVLQSAINSSELKKEKIVELKDALSEPLFSLVTGDSGVYYLDYPSKSMIPGYVLFPSRGEIMKPVFLQKCLDSLLRKIKLDGDNMATSLNHVFTTIGVRNTKILNDYKFHYPMLDSGYLPISFVKTFSRKQQPFYVPAWVAYKETFDTTLNPKFGLLLSSDEYQQVIEALFSITGTKDYTQKSRLQLYNHLYDVVSNHLYKNNIAIDDDRPLNIQYLTLAELLQLLTGHRTAHPLWTSIQLGMIKSKRKSSKEDVLRFLNTCKTKALQLQENINNTKLHFYSSGQKYYFLSSEFLP